MATDATDLNLFGGTALVAAVIAIGMDAHRSVSEMQVAVTREYMRFEVTGVSSEASHKQFQRIQYETREDGLFWFITKSDYIMYLQFLFDFLRIFSSFLTRLRSVVILSAKTAKD